MFYSSDALFVLFQPLLGQPLLSKIDPSSGEILYNLTIPFTSCYPCAPWANGLQVNENFAIITVENGTLWELFTIDIVAAQPTVLAVYVPSAPSFISNLMQDGQNSILIIENFQPTPTTIHVTYDVTGTIITVSTISTPPIPGVNYLAYGAINLTPKLALACASLTSISPPYNNLISFEINRGNVKAAANAGWGYACPIVSISTMAQGVCAYFTLSEEQTQRLWCWNYSEYLGLIPTQVISYDIPGVAYEGVGDDAGNFIGCYTNNTNSYLIQYSVDYDQSTYEVIATAPLKQNYHCVSSSFPLKPIMNNRISTTLQQVAITVSIVNEDGKSQYSVLAVNYDNSLSESSMTK